MILRHLTIIILIKKIQIFGTIITMKLMIIVSNHVCESDKNSNNNKSNNNSNDCKDTHNINSDSGNDEKLDDLHIHI